PGRGPASIGPRSWTVEGPRRGAGRARPRAGFNWATVVDRGGTLLAWEAASHSAAASIGPRSWTVEGRRPARTTRPGPRWLQLGHGRGPWRDPIASGSVGEYRRASIGPRSWTVEGRRHGRDAGAERPASIGPRSWTVEGRPGAPGSWRRCS